MVYCNIMQSLVQRSNSQKAYNSWLIQQNVMVKLLTDMFSPFLNMQVYVTQCC